MGNERQRPDWKRALRSLETPGAEAASLAGVAASWLFRERFPALPTDDEAWRDIEERELVLPVSDTPEVSIVVPVYGKFATTWACLDSLAWAYFGNGNKAHAVELEKEAITLLAAGDDKSGYLAALKAFQG